ncbi:MAG TPA: GspMb/PilO family protein [Burkholderiales bacterium]|nr:GspMb/PilO family protein [Burkholderiales bacterium]
MKHKIQHHLYRLRDELGITGLAALFLFAAAGLFMTFVLQPLKDKNRILESRAGSVRELAPGQAGNAAEKIGAVYQYLEKAETTTDWLAKLYAIGKATGVELQSASYKTQSAGGRLERYEIVVPLTGSYTQMRDFLKRSLAEIPVLSLDQISLKRENRREGTVQAELRLTLHMVKS